MPVERARNYSNLKGCHEVSANISGSLDDCIAHRIHVWYIYLHLLYMDPMDPMGWIVASSLGKSITAVLL